MHCNYFKVRISSLWLEAGMYHSFWSCSLFLHQCDGGEVVGSAWLGQPGDKLEGFHWRGGTDRDTMGILMWSEPFFRTLPTGEEVRSCRNNPSFPFTQRYWVLSLFAWLASDIIWCVESCYEALFEWSLAFLKFYRWDVVAPHGVTSADFVFSMSAMWLCALC